MFPNTKSLAALAIAAFSMSQMNATAGTVRIQKTPFGDVEGKPIDLYVMTTSHGVEAAITNYGGTVVSMKVPDKSGKLADVALGFDDLKGYLQTEPYFGALIGRYANRIAKGHFKLNGKDYQVPVNDGANALHGGLKGFDKVIWTAKPVTGPKSASLELTYLSKNGEEGYPGNLATKVIYTLADSGELRIDYTATTDKDTVLNLTNHSYFNLAGAGAGDILKHQVKLYASRYTPVDSGLIPTGELRAVKGTPFDFLQAHEIGERIGDGDEQLKLGKGYDHNWVLDSDSGKLEKAAEVYEPTSGRVLELWTTQPGIQFYTGNFLDGTLTGKGGHKYAFRDGLALETQHFPDSPNHPTFPGVVLKPKQTYHQVTVWKFLTR